MELKISISDMNIRIYAVTTNILVFVVVVIMLATV